MPEHHSIVIVGSGLGGLGVAMRLKRDGIEDFVILEKAADLGGTWRENTYPGCACDVPSVMYSWSFAPNPDWSRFFAPAAEIWEYTRRVATEAGVIAHIRYGHTVGEAVWNEERTLWEIPTDCAGFTAEVLISAVGALHVPSVPTLPGIEKFAGSTFHTAEWGQDFTMEGARVAVVGTGASAIQVVPAIQPLVARLTLFQRTPPWVLPRIDPKFPPALRSLFRHVPATQKLLRGLVYAAAETVGYCFHRPRVMAVLQRAGRRHIETQVRDAALAAQLTPDYTLGCKRILTSNTYFPAVACENTELVTAGIKEVCAAGIIDNDGVLHELDAIIWGTGFEVIPMAVGDLVRGRDGRTLREHWSATPTAYFGTAVAGFPNFFMLLGPGTGLGHNSLIYMMEAQADYIASALSFMREHDVATVEPRVEAQQRWVEKVDRRMAGTVWLRGGCSSWYLDDSGRNAALWPSSTWHFRRSISTFVPADNFLGINVPVRDTVSV